MEKDNKGFAQDLEQSEEEFARQFDRASVAFHGGDPTPVPIGGARVPTSMPTMYADEPKKETTTKESNQIEEVKSTETKPPVDSKEVEAHLKKLDELLALRTFMGEVKATLNLICPPLESILRLKLKEGPHEKEKEQPIIDAELAKVKITIDKLSVQNDALMKTQFKDKYCETINIIIKDAFKDFKDKEDYATYQFLVKKFTSNCFQDQAKLLDEIKKVKKLLPAEYKS
jgi:hypothetical protein